MIYSVTLGEKHLFRDFGVYVKTKVINMPEVQTNYVEIPARDGLLDLSEVLTGRPIYKNRTITISCKILSQYADRYKIISDIGNYLHGKTMRIVFDEETDWYYIGRLSIVSPSVNTANGTFDIVADCEPYKHMEINNQEPWLWDPFDFVNGYINDFYVIVKENDSYDAQFKIDSPTINNIVIESNKFAQIRLNDGNVISVNSGLNNFSLAQLNFSVGVNSVTFINNSAGDAIIKTQWDEKRL